MKKYLFLIALLVPFYSANAFAQTQLSCRGSWLVNLDSEKQSTKEGILLTLRTLSSTGTLQTELLMETILSVRFLKGFYPEGKGEVVVEAALDKIQAIHGIAVLCDRPDGPLPRISGGS